MKIASVLLLLILLLGIFLSPPRGEEVEEGYTHFTYIGNQTQEILGKEIYAVTILNHGFLNLSIEIKGIAPSPCGNKSSILFFSIYVDGKLAQGSGGLLMGMRAMEDLPMFYGFNTSGNWGMNAISWSGDYDGGLVTEAWAPRTAYDGFTITSTRFRIGTEGFWNMKESHGSLRIYVRLLGMEDIRATIDLTIAFH